MEPVGTILPYGGNVFDESVKDDLKDNGWLVCDGGDYNENEYPELHKVIGKNFGYDQDNKKPLLPDLRGLFLRGVDPDGKKDPEAKDRTALNGGATGDQVGSYQEDQFMSHAHEERFAHTSELRGESKGDPPAVAGTPINHTDPRGIKSGGKETRPKNIYVNFIIKAI